MRFLVVDDKPEILMLVTMMLEREFGPCDGNEGLAALSAGEEKPDVIISNLRMPSMDGFTFMREVRQNNAWADIHVVAMSALTSPDVLAKAETSGAELFLRKPFTFNNFKEVMEQLI
jgi:CheY-like chemotaxis protein